MTIFRSVSVTNTAILVVLAGFAMSACAGEDATPTPPDNTNVVVDPKKPDEPVLLKSGEVCKGDGECDSGKCTDNLCAVGKLKLDEACKLDGECLSGVCFSQACAATCVGSKDCTGDKACLTDNGKRQFCATPSFHKELGVSCAAHGNCPAGLECSHPAEAAIAICTSSCAGDVDCPTHLTCAPGPNATKRCMPRVFCDTCLSDSQCGAGKTCTEMGDAKFCSQSCNAGSTECPRFTECQDVGDNNFQCVHRNGTCKDAVADSCSPCLADEECPSGGSCLGWPYTGERFCGKPCKGAGDCGSGQGCVEIGKKDSGNFQCVPTQTKINGKLPLYTCVNKITPQGEKGDIMSDFKMVGVVDIDGDGQLTDEEPRVLRLSDFSAHSVIFLTVAAGWCSACQQETKDFKALYKKYGGELVIFQILFQGFEKSASSYATFKVLKSWNSNLKPIGGAIGVDFTRRIQTYNWQMSTPMSMLIDAKTRLILDKWNGYSHAGLVSKLAALPHLKKK
jgi:hypothetical protein